MRGEQKPLPTAAEWDATADSILRETKDQTELLLMAKIASRVQIQALLQYGQSKDAKHPNDDELLTPKEVSDVTGASLWSVREAIRQKKLPVWLPHLEAVRGCKVPRGVARLWAAETSGDSLGRRHRY